MWFRCVRILRLMLIYVFGLVLCYVCCVVVVVVISVLGVDFGYWMFSVMLYGECLVLIVLLVVGWLSMKVVLRCDLNVVLLFVFVFFLYILGFGILVNGF